MTRLFELIEHPDLDSPVLIVALDGWIDAGAGAARATASILEGIEATTLVRFDGDALLDYRSRRPIMRLEAGMNRGLTWPEIEIVAFSDAEGNDVLMLAGPEPDHLWKAFTQAVVDLALEFGVRTVIGLGAYPAPVPHTRASNVAATATDENLAALASATTSTLEVPAGISGAIEERCAEVGLPAIGLWAQVPHYAAAMPYPGAALALVEKVNEIGQLSFPTGTLAEDASATRTKLDELVANSAEHVALLGQLESQADLADSAPPLSGSPSDLPSGDELAGEIERFLRGQGGQ